MRWSVEVSLPDREFGGETIREASFDNPDSALESCLWREEERWSGMTTKA
jgi:hypothetical protein